MGIDIIKRLTNRTKKLDYIGKIYADDTFIVSYPKSGNTWMRLFLAMYLNQGQALSYDEIEDIIPSVHKSSARVIAERKRPRMIKCHFPDLEQFPKVIYVVRDGRDAMVSYYHYLQELKGFSGSFEDFYFSDIHTATGKWHWHVGKALECRARNQHKILIVKYEDMLRAPETVFRSVIEFCRLRMNTDHFKSALKNSDFNAVQKQNRDRVVIEGRKINFFRKGTSNQWKSYFTERALVDFVQNSRSELVAFDYDIDD